MDRSYVTVCTVTIRRTSVRPPLSNLENEVMTAVWNCERASVEAIHEVISQKRDLKEVTVRTLLRRLEQKGYLSHRVEGRAFVYQATESSRSLAARAVRQIVDRFCQGSMEELISGMVDAKVLSKRELDRLEEMVRRRREGGGL